MSSSQGTEYYLKSMNGIKVFDDGSGTVIEDDTITVKTIDCEIINADTFFTDTFNLEVLNTTSLLSLTGNLTVDCDLTTAGTTYTDTISSKTGATGTIQLIGDVLATKIKPDYIEVLNNISCLNCSADESLNCITLQADYVNISSLGNISTDTIISPSGNLTVNGSIGATGNLTVNGSIGATGNIIGDTLYTYGNINNVSDSTTSRLFFNATTGNIGIGQNQTSGTIGIGTLATRTGEIRMGATGCNIDIRGPTQISSGKLTVNGGIDSTGTITTANLTATGIIKTAIIQPPSLITQIEFFKDTTLPLFFTKFKFQNTDITSTAISDTVNLFNNLTTGILNMGNALIGGTISMGTAITGGIINIGTALQGGSVNIGNATTPAGTNGGFVNIGTGSKSNITIGNATDNSTATSRGCCRINKLVVNNSTKAIRGMTGGLAGAGIGNGIVAFGFTFVAIPIVIATIQGGVGSSYNVQISNITTTQFSFQKYFGNIPQGVPTAEAFSWFAFCVN